MDRYPLIRRWGNDQNLHTVTDSRGVRYIPFTKIAYLAVVDSDSEPEVYQESNVLPRPRWDDFLPDHEVMIPRPSFERDNMSILSSTQDFEIPRPVFTPKRNTLNKQGRVLSIRSSRSAFSPPAPRNRPSRDRFVRSSSRPLPKREPLGFWSVLSQDPPLRSPKPRYSFKNVDVYPPRKDGEGLLGAKRKLIKEAIASSEPGFEFYGRDSFDYMERHSTPSIILSSSKFSRFNAPYVNPDRPYVPPLWPFHSEPHSRSRSPTPPLPERRYRDMDLEPSSSSVSAFTPFEGQIASRNRTSVLTRWQDTLTRVASRRQLSEAARLYDIEENPDY